ncbi:acyl-CoA reductase-like NAD-dependent aldehyde dehydrogenase [Actinoplanes tereljensis]|uniref:Aldehyde dehydrogenase n=1 Tax=Paractinoplanes tereljensis TaxID=571912 RepID=A0A919TRC2_9ACTN|nr:aldehyde dehydrogenase family protein [Actinoplanes tereljensis]GIF20103.1 aldehyde dehydrogenase [Actinoplanes tereljensis]
MISVRHHIGGREVASVSGRSHPDLDPWSRAVLAEVASGDGEDARLAIEAAHAAFPAWSALAPTERQLIFIRAADALGRRRESVIDLLAAETGCGAHFAGIQFDFSLSLLRQAAGLTHQPTGQILPTDLPGSRALAVRRPVGVVAAIAPWNAALSLAGRAIVGPLALGNTVVLKPSEESPITGGTLWAEVFAEAGLPAGAVNVVTHAPGDAGMIAEELVTHPLVRRISFTGSTVTGRRLAELAARHLKRPVLQLSGHNPLVVLADADLTLAVDAATYGAFVHQGEICMCVRRIIVDESVAAEFTSRFIARVEKLPVGDPRDPTTVVGPLINEWALSLVERRVAEAVSLGARVLTGGTAVPPCYPPTVLTNVPAEAEIAFEETFGPVALLETAAGPEDALRRANASRYGLTAAIISADTYRALDLARRLEVGIVHINDQTVHDEPQMPFGGLKDSGWGRFGLQFADEDFTELQWITMRDSGRTFPF